MGLVVAAVARAVLHQMDFLVAEVGATRRLNGEGVLDLVRAARRATRRRRRPHNQYVKLQGAVRDF